MRTYLAAAEDGDTRQLAEFGTLLRAHVRFEERELFPACEALVDGDVLTRVAQRAPKGKGPSVLSGPAAFRESGVKRTTPKASAPLGRHSAGGCSGFVARTSNRDSR